MIIEPHMFPSDTNGILGSLRKELTNCIHKSTNKTSYLLVKETLKAALSILEDAKKEAETNDKARVIKNKKMQDAADKLKEVKAVASPLFELFVK